MWVKLNFRPGSFGNIFFFFLIFLETFSRGAGRDTAYARTLYFAFEEVIQMGFQHVSSFDSNFEARQYCQIEHNWGKFSSCLSIKIRDTFRTL